MELIPLDPRAAFGAYRELVEDVAGVLWELDLATFRFTFASPQAASILGHAAERLVAEPALWPSSLHPDDRPRWQQACADCRRDAGTFDIDVRLRGADGITRWVRAVAKATSRPGLAPVLRGLFLDIARRKQAEAEAERLMHEATATAAALRASEESYRLLADSVPDQVWTAQPDGRLDYVNGRVLEYFGRSFDQMIGEGWLDVLHPADVDPVVQRWLRSLGTGEGYQVEFRLRRADGDYRWHIGRALPQRDAAGRVVKWFGTNTDVEDERRAEAARDRALADARAERQRLYEVFMQAPAAITVLEGDEHVFTVSNPRYQELTGNRELVGKPARQATPELEGQGFFELLDAVYASGLPYAADERPVRLDRDGDGNLEELYLDFVYQPLKDAQGHTFGVLAHAVEVTEKVRARDAIAAARAEAERANRAKSQFLAAMSHDLRTPLNAIGGYAELVAEGMYGPVTEAQRNAMTRIQGAAKHLLALITDILSFAKIEAGSLQLELADLPVNATLAELAPLVELQIREKGLAFELERGPDDVRMRGDAERTTQILINLLTNAVKFTPAGTIGVRWEADERAVRVHVRDTGRGIPPDRLEAIFEPFVQAGRTAEEQQQGVGLGLATSRELARAMGGELTAVSVPGEGSTFTLKLPRSA